MRSLRDALRAAGVVGLLGSTVVFATIALARCAEAQDAGRAMRGGYATRPVPNSQVGRLPSAGISWDF